MTASQRHNPSPDNWQISEKIKPITTHTHNMHEFKRRTRKVEDSVHAIIFKVVFNRVLEADNISFAFDMLRRVIGNLKSGHFLFRALFLHINCKRSTIVHQDGKHYEWIKLLSNDFVLAKGI